MCPSRFFLLLAVLFLSACTHDAPQDDTPSATSPPNSSAAPTLSEEEAVALIRERYQATMNELSLDKLARKVVEFQCEEDPLVGQTTYFSNAEGVLKMIENSYTMGDHAGATEQYFLEGGKVYFVHKTEGSWTFGKSPESTIDHSTEYRYYIYDQTLVRCLKKAYTIDADQELPTQPSDIPNEDTDCPSLENLNDEVVLLEGRLQAGTDGEILSICTTGTLTH